MKRQDLELGLLLGGAGASLALFTVTEGWRKHLESAQAPNLLEKLRVLRDRGSLDLLLRATTRRSGIMFGAGMVAGLLMRPVAWAVRGEPSKEKQEEKS